MHSLTIQKDFWGAALNQSAKSKIMFVMGARPNFMKIAPLVRFYKSSRDLQNKFDVQLVHTGQHYDDSMSGVFLRRLGIDSVDHCLNVGPGSQANQTAKIMTSFEEVCLSSKPEMVVVVGDVNSTLACAITAKKLSIKVCHIEAGLRSFNRAMPEEINRIVTDSITDLFFTTSPEAKAQLLKEGIDSNRIYFVGNLMIDSLLHEWKLRSSNGQVNKEKICLVTLHRPSNVDQMETLRAICENLLQIANQIPVVFPIHPRTKSSLESNGLLRLLNHQNIHIELPADYTRMIELYSRALFVVTDSGGVQEETTALGIPCLTLREETERPVTVDVGTNTMIGHNWLALHENVRQIINQNYKVGKIPDMWDGKTSERIWSVFESLGSL